MKPPPRAGPSAAVGTSVVFALVAVTGATALPVRVGQVVLALALVDNHGTQSLGS